MKFEFAALIVWTMLTLAAGENGYELSIYQETPGVYFEDLGHVTLSTTTWTILVYVPVQMTGSEIISLEHYAHYIDGICAKLSVKRWTACNYFSELMTSKLQQIRTNQKLLFDIVQERESEERRRRGLFNFIGKVSKALFGTMDDDDAQFYHDHIEHLEQGSTTLTQLLKKQLIVVKSALGTVNATLTDVEYNERKMREGLGALQSHVATLGTQVDNATHLLSLKITLENHIVRALDAAEAVLRNFDILVDSIATAQKGTLAPRVISPLILLDALRNSSSFFPSDTTLPVPLSKDYIHMIYQLCEVRVYVREQRIGYVISVPLVHKRIFNVLKVIPIPVRVNLDKFVYIEVGEPILCRDQTKQYYFGMTEGQLAECKTIKPREYVCKHQRTLLSTAVTNSCAVMMLQRKDTIPPSCDMRVVRFPHTVWIQLRNNTWIYFAPHSDTLTIVCPNGNPIDITVRGTGKLYIYPGCKGYSTTAILYGSVTINNASTIVKGDFLSQVTIQYDCCDEAGIRINLSQLTLDLPHPRKIAHLDDLRYASKRVSDILEEIKEQEWKNSHIGYRNTHSVLLTFVISIVFIYSLYKLYTWKRSSIVTWLCKRGTHPEQTVKTSAEGNNTNTPIKGSNDSLDVTDTMSHSPTRTPRPQTSKSYF